MLLAATWGLAPAAKAFSSLPATNANRTLVTDFVVKASPPSDSTGVELTDAQLEAYLDTDFYMYNYITTGYNASRVQRAVITIAGEGRDAWDYFDVAYTALLNATSRTELDQHKVQLSKHDVVIMAPQFMNQQDIGCYPVDANNVSTSNALVYDTNDWSQGGDSIYPTSINDTNNVPFNISGVSSYQAIDTAVAWFANKTIFPNMKTIIVAGHSMGAQTVQRYALLGAVPSGTVPVNFVIANPGSYAYLTDWRPRSTANCSDTFNNWKYGLAEYNQSYLADFVADSLNSTDDVENIVQRYRRRVINYLYGLADHGPGDTRCEALTQGTTHLARGRYFMKYLAAMPGGFPASQTVDYVPGIAHDPMGMFISDAGITRLFYDNLNGTERPTAVGDDDSGARRWAQTQGMTTSTTSALPTATGTGAAAPAIHASSAVSLASARTGVIIAIQAAVVGAVLAFSHF